MESVWHLLKKMWNKNLIYRLQTPLSTFEAGENYKEVSDRAIAIPFKVSGENIEFVAWTTASWTRPRI
jgi:isoleucyl-tRNA synthetase